MSNNFTLLRNFIDIINNRYGLIISAKYHDSNMNDVHTKSSYDIASCPAKVIWPITFFSNSEHLFCVTFVLAISCLTWGQLVRNIWYIVSIMSILCICILFLVIIIIRRFWKYYFVINLYNIHWKNISVWYCVCMVCRFMSWLCCKSGIWSLGVIGSFICVSITYVWCQ